MSTQINVVVDAKGIISQNGTNNNDLSGAVLVNPDHVYMVSKGDNSQMNGTASLRVSVPTGEQLRWRTFTISTSAAGEGTYTAMILHITREGGDVVLGTIGESDPTLGIPEPRNPLKEHIKNLGTQVYKDFYLEAVAENPGSEHYNIYFALYDRSGNYKGVFKTKDPILNAVKR